MNRNIKKTKSNKYRILNKRIKTLKKKLKLQKQQHELEMGLQSEKVKYFKTEFERIKKFKISRSDIISGVLYIKDSSMRIILKNILQTIMKQYQDFLSYSNGKYFFYKQIPKIDIPIAQLNDFLKSLFDRKQIFKDIVHIEKSVSLLGFIEPDLYQGLHLDELQQNFGIDNFSTFVRLLISDTLLTDILFCKFFPMKMQDFYNTLSVKRIPQLSILLE